MSPQFKRFKILRTTARILAACLLVSGTNAYASCPLNNADRGAGVKWYPGHYISVQGPEKDIRVQEFLTRYRGVQAARGVQKTYFWSELEKSPGVYDFTKIDRDIALLAQDNKKLAIIIGYKYRASATQSSLPTYILNQAPQTVVLPNGTSVVAKPYFVQGYEGDYSFNNGQHANFGHPGTLAAFKKLLNALSARYDNDLSFVAITFVETSIGASVTANEQEAFLNGILAMEQHAGCTFKRTPIFQNLNYPRKKLGEFTQNLKAYGLGMGGPDTFIGSFDLPTNGLAFVNNMYPGVYWYYQEMSRTVPIGQQVHHENFEYATHELQLDGVRHNLSAAASVDKIYTFSMTHLKPNYMFWFTNGQYDAYGQALEARLKSAAGLPLNTACPPVYGVCYKWMPPTDR